MTPQIEQRLREMAEGHYDHLKQKAVSFGDHAIASWKPSDSFLTGSREGYEIGKLAGRIELLRALDDVKAPGNRSVFSEAIEKAEASLAEKLKGRT